MKNLETIGIFIVVFSFFPGIAINAAPQDQCFVCHQALGDAPATLFAQDVHRRKGISCAGCHGGDATADDMTVAMDKKTGFIGVPSGNEMSRVCAGCHSDAERMKQFNSTLPTGQFEKLETSVHGKLALSGGERIAQCTTCHGAHGILRVKNPKSPVAPANIVTTCTGCHSNAGYIRSYNPALPVDQLEKYRTSVHGVRNAKGDVKVAECASCHGAHDILPAGDGKSRTYPTNLPNVCAGCHSNAEYMKEYNLPTDQFEAFSRSVHGVALLERNDVNSPACNDCHGNHGATPPGVASISKVCGTCHALNADLFSASRHKKSFDEMGLPECETCHGNHGILSATTELLGTGPEAVCSRCHAQDDQNRGFSVAATMRELADSLEGMEEDSRVLVEEADQKGMDMEEMKFKLREVRQARLEARTTVHTFDEQKFRDVAGKGIAAATVVRGEAVGAIDEYYFRRIGLGIATLIISILAISLFLYIRRIERTRNAE